MIDSLFSGPSTPQVITLGTACVVSWLVAYVGIIRRGFKDATFGMPVAALAANISWEAIYSFVYEPFGDYLHNLSVICFIIDVPIAVQCFLYGPKDFASPFIRRYFRLVLAFAVASAYPLLLYSFYEFHDPAGEYTGFGINFMMSILFVAMIIRRNSSAGQSMYIAISKWLGTLFSYLATALEATTDRAHPWPESLGSIVIKSFEHRAYPLTPLINYLYLFIFFLDIVYVILLYRKLREERRNPWTRF